MKKEEVQYRKNRINVTEYNYLMNLRSEIELDFIRLHNIDKK